MGNRVKAAGDSLGLTHEGALTLGDQQISRECVNATITVSAEDTNVRDIAIQLKDAYGNDITYAETVEVVMFLTADKLAFVTTGGSTGIEIGTDGALLPIVAKKLFIATSEIDGDIDLTWTDTGTEAAFLGLRLPNGRIIISDALANAA